MNNNLLKTSFIFLGIIAIVLISRMFIAKDSRLVKPEVSQQIACDASDPVC